MSTRGSAVSFLETGGPGAWWILRGGRLDRGRWSMESRREAGLLQRRVWGVGASCGAGQPGRGPERPSVRSVAQL